MNKYLVLKGYCGLGDRLHTLLSAIKYAKDTNRILYVDWADWIYGTEKKNVFYDYFQLKNVSYISDPKEIEDNVETYYPKIWKGKITSTSLNEMYTFGYPVNIPKVRGIYWLERNVGGRLGRLLRHWKYIGLDNSQYKTRGSDWNAVKSLISSKDMSYGRYLSKSIKSDVVLYADSIPPLEEEKINDYIFLEQSLMNKIDDFVRENKLFDKTIGVHVRNTDLFPTKDVRDFVKKLKEFMGNGYEKVFLATDSKEIELLFEQEIKDVIKYPKELIANNIEGLHHICNNRNSVDKLSTHLAESIIDLWLLSKCNFLFYQKNSSFSMVAKMLMDNESQCIDWLKW
jgi:hypothetical protein